MKHILANATSYQGISVDAEHYYCKVEIIDTLDLIDRLGSNMDTIYVKGHEEMTYIPTLAEAEALCEKDNSGYMAPEDYIEQGTTRFSSLHAIQLELCKQYPGYTYTIAYDGSIKKFNDYYNVENLYIVYDEQTPEVKQKLIEYFLKDENYQRWADWYCRQQVCINVYKNKRQYEYVEKIKEFKN